MLQIKGLTVSEATCAGHGKTAGRTGSERQTNRIVSRRYIVSKTNTEMGKGVGICFRPRSTYNSFVWIEAGWVALFYLDFFVTFFTCAERCRSIKEKSWYKIRAKRVNGDYNFD
jgi:hypothetical protein